MKDSGSMRRRQKSPVFVALLLFNLVFVLIQLWLFVSVLDDLLVGQARMAVPAATISVVILAANIWMLRGIDKMDSSS